MSIEGIRVEVGAALAPGEAFLNPPTFNRDEVLSRVIKEMQPDDRHPREVVQDRYNGDWDVYLGDMARMLKMV